jgi:phosphoglycolate phosphatase-like HAD superfamily hydrolase
VTGPAETAPEFLRQPRDWAVVRRVADPAAAQTAAGVRPPSGGPTAPAPRDRTWIGRDHLRAGRDNITVHMEQPPENLERFLAKERRRVRYATDLASLTEDMRLVISPPGLEEHLRALRHHGLLVLSGKPHSGLPTAVRHRVWRLAEDLRMAKAHPLFPDDLDDLCRSIDDLERPTVLFVDLSDDAASGARLAATLPQLQASLRERSSYLGISVGHEYHEELEAAMSDVVFGLRQPPARAVLTAYLRGTPGERRLDAILGDDQFQAMIAASWPPRLRRLAAIINAAPTDLQVGELFEQVKDGLDDWTRDLHRRFETDIDATSRSLLVAAAALEGADIERIVEAARDFLDGVAYSVERPHLLEDSSLTAEFDRVAQVFDPARSQFTRSGYGDAVLPHVWKEYPRWRAPIVAWFDRLLRKPAYLDDESLARVVVRLVGLAARQHEGSLVTQAAYKIVGRAVRGESSEDVPVIESGYVELASQLLLEGAVDAFVGRQVRDQLRRWVYRESASVPLQWTVATTCANPDYARQYPSNAMTRLRHASRSGDRRVVDTVVRGVTEVAVHVRPWLLLAKLTEWIGTDDPRVRRIVPRVVTEVFGDTRVRSALMTDPDAVAHDAGQRIRRFWQLLFQKAEPAAARAAVESWLGAAAVLPPGAANAMAAHLVAAARRDYRGLGQLAYAVRAGLPLGTDADPRGRLHLTIMSDLLKTKDVRP